MKDRNKVRPKRSNVTANEKTSCLKKYGDMLVQEEFIVSENVNSFPGKKAANSSDVAKKNYPKRKYRAGAILATVWANQGRNNAGQLQDYNTVSLERVYQDRQGNWKSTNSMRVNDLPKVAAVMQRAYGDLLIKEQELFKSEVNV